ncbi:flavin reductase family protein [Bacteroidia bacterium]|nr:flavin reductase family protein [Bacteroidia bacterium]MDA9213684.1 flavin reductase family protein [Bacteroidia bacterium]
MLTINPNEIETRFLHQYLIGSVGPRPICFASTVDRDGKPNLAPFSFFNVFSANPPILVFAPNNSGRTGEPKHTFLNAKAVPEVVINVVTAEMVEQMNVAAAPWDQGVDEFEKAGFTPVESDLVKPFRVAESPSQIECKVLEIKEMGTGGGAGNLVICEVLRIHIKDEVLNEDQKIDQTKMNLVGRLGGSWYSRTDKSALFELAQPMKPTVGYNSLPNFVKESDELTANELGKLCGVLNNPEKDASVSDTVDTCNWLKVKNLISEGNAEAALSYLLSISMP